MEPSKSLLRRCLGFPTLTRHLDVKLPEETPPVDEESPLPAPLEGDSQVEVISSPSGFGVGFGSLKHLLAFGPQVPMKNEGFMPQNMDYNH